MNAEGNKKPEAINRKAKVKSGGTLARIDSVLGVANRFMVYIASIALFGMMAVVVIDVIGRYAFSRPLMGAYELVGYLMAIAGPSAIGYSQLQKGHIRVDFILKRFPNRVQSVITGIAYLIGIFVFSVLCWCMVTKAQYFMSLKHGNTTDTMGIPIAPFVIMVAIGLGMLALVLVFDLIHTIAEVKKK